MGMMMRMNNMPLKVSVTVQNDQVWATLRWPNCDKSKEWNSSTVLAHVTRWDANYMDIIQMHLNTMMPRHQCVSLRATEDVNPREAFELEFATVH